MTIQDVLVVGAGSAGLLAALALKRRIPRLKVRVVASSKLGIIGVGEGTVPYVAEFIHRYLGLDEQEFFQRVDPVYKLGVRFTWGKRAHFHYTFTTRQWAWKHPSLPRPSGYYESLGHLGIDLPGALMEAEMALPRRADGLPDVPPPGQFAAWHLENHRFVEWLDHACRAAGVKFIDAEIASVDRGETGVKSLRLANGASLKADLFVDASGFRSELLGGALEEPFIPYSDALFCDRAIVGGWERAEGEPVLPFTVSDTMDSGWAWRIDHPERINRGYVYSSDHIGDDEAEREFLGKNPRLGSTRLVTFRSGRHRRAWADNVVAIGNAAAFVEPLEATAIMCICLQSRWLVDGLLETGLQPTPSLIRLYNRYTAGLWDEIREFLALHYQLNTRLDTPFWRRCREETPLTHAAELLDFYRENGPSAIASVMIPRDSPFGLEGYFAMLVGMQASCQRAFSPTPAEAATWHAHLEQNRRLAAAGFTMPAARQALMDSATWKKLRGQK